MIRSSGWRRSQAPRSGTTASITTSSITKAVQVTQLSVRAMVSRAPPGWDSLIATAGITSAEATSMNGSSRAAIRVLRSSIPGS